MNTFRPLLCVLIAVGVIGCGSRPTDFADPLTQAVPQAYPVATDVPVSLPTVPPLPYPAPTIPPVVGQAATPIADSLLNLQVSPDGRYVVYNSDPERDRVYGLFSLQLDGGTPIQLNTLISEPAPPFTFAITQDSNTVIYTNEQNLYRVPIGGGVPERLASAVMEFKLSPDGQWVLAWESRDRLVSIPLAGGQPVQLGQGLGNSTDYAVTPDSRRVVFIQRNEEFSRLWQVPISGGTPALLSPPEAEQGRIIEFGISADGQYVVFGIHDPLRASSSSLMSTALSGGSPTMLWDAQQNPFGYNWFNISPDGRSVLFAPLEEDELPQYLVVPVGGGMVTPIGEPLSNLWYDSDYLVVDDHLIYNTKQTDDLSMELYSVSLTGGAPIRLSGPRPFGNGYLFYQVAPQAGRVVFAADLETRGVVGLYSIPATGGTPTLLSAQIPPGASVEQFILSDDQALAVFRVMWGSRAASAAVYAARLDGSQMWQVLGGGGIMEFLLLPDDRILYQTDKDRDSYWELLIAPLRTP